MYVHNHMHILYKFCVNIYIMYIHRCTIYNNMVVDSVPTQSFLSKTLRFSRQRNCKSTWLVDLTLGLTWASVTMYQSIGHEQYESIWNYNLNPYESIYKPKWNHTNPNMNPNMNECPTNALPALCRPPGLPPDPRLASKVLDWRKRCRRWKLVHSGFSLTFSESLDIFESPWSYRVVNYRLAIEKIWKGPAPAVYSWSTHKKWWLSIVMLVCQRVFGDVLCCVRMWPTGLLTHIIWNMWIGSDINWIWGSPKP